MLAKCSGWRLLKRDVSGVRKGPQTAWEFFLEYVGPRYCIGVFWSLEGPRTATEFFLEYCWLTAD